jgi:DNA repair protein RecN (Recombination protein N)
VLTGETGAGKSILIDALQLALGARADAGVVREGATRADISVEFDTPASLAPWLEEAGFDAADTLLLRRTWTARAKAAPGSTAARPPPRSCASWASNWWISTASMPGKA